MAVIKDKYFLHGAGWDAEKSDSGGAGCPAYFLLVQRKRLSLLKALSFNAGARAFIEQMLERLVVQQKAIFVNHSYPQSYPHLSYVAGTQ
jgi:hypothetical protein